MKLSFGSIVSFAYSLGEASAEGANAGLSIHVSMNPNSKSSKTNYAVSSTFGFLTWSIEFLSNYFFQGAEIRKRLSYDDLHGTQDQNELEILLEEEVSTKRKATYLGTKYLYIASTLAIDYLSICFVYSATKAWIQDFYDGEDKPLTFITHEEGVLILLADVALYMPFVMSNKITQTCKEMRKMFGIHPNQAPDKAMMRGFSTLVRPIAKNTISRKYVRIAGSISDTMLHVTPLVIIIPPSWILEIASGPAVLAWGSLGVASLTVAIVASTILTQTYLFEGKFSEQNLQTVANQFGDQIDEETPWVPPIIAKIFHKLLYVGGPLHGFDTSLSYLLTLREFQAPNLVTNPIAFAGFIIAWLGNHYSEVKESQETLKKITKISAVSNSSTFFAEARRGYGAIQNPERTEFQFTSVAPCMLENYQPPVHAPKV